MNTAYKALITEDGSPSLSLPPTWEPMHSLEGAFSETLYIYQPTVEKAYQAVSRPSFTSVGLGLGYNEILIACEAFSNNKQPDLIHSYESQNFLRDNFIKWFQGEQNDLTAIYEKIAGFYASQYHISTQELSEQLLQWYNGGQLLLKSALNMETSIQKVNGVLFDAFCSKTTEELWTPEFLELFISKSSSDNCFLSTYACTGLLKRTLEKHNYSVEKCKGFGKKRHSTFAARAPSPLT